MKQYLLFAGCSYYAEGGWTDFQADYDTFPEAKEAGERTAADWWHVVDAETKEYIAGKEGSYCGRFPQGTEL